MPVATLLALPTASLDTFLDDVSELLIQRHAIGVAVFGVQAMTSQWWVSRFRFGPMEWLWRYWTYGRRPAFARRS